MAAVLAHVDMREVVVACVPASSAYSHARRYKRFSSLLCRAVNAVNGYDHISVCCNRKRAHISGEYELCSDISRCISIDRPYFQGKKVLVVDDICTTGKSASAFISALQDAGADVCMALFLAKTKRYRR